MNQQTFQNKNIYRDFDLSFGRNPLTNDVSKKLDANSINQALRTLVSTDFLERPFRPTVGSRVKSLLFEPADPITIIELKNAVTELIINHEPRVEVQKLDVIDLPDHNAYSVVLIYNLVNVLETQEIKITLKRLR